MDFIWKLGLYFESGKAFYSVHWSLGLYSIGIYFSRWLKMLPVLAACSGARRWAVALQKHKTTPKFPEKHDWEEDEKQSVLKSQVCK